MLEVNSVDGSTVPILNLSVAAGDPHEGITGLLLAFLGSGDIFLQLLQELEGFGVSNSNFVGNLFFFYAFHGSKLVEGGLPDRNNIFNDVPEDAFVTRGGSH